MTRLPLFTPISLTNTFQARWIDYNIDIQKMNIIKIKKKEKGGRKSKISQV